MQNIIKLESYFSKSLYEGAQNVRQETGKSLPVSCRSLLDTGLDSNFIQLNSSELIPFVVNSQSRMRYMDLDSRVHHGSLIRM